MRLGFLTGLTDGCGRAFWMTCTLHEAELGASRFRPGLLDVTSTQNSTYCNTPRRAHWRGVVSCLLSQWAANNLWSTLWIVPQVKGTGHQMYQVRELAVTYLVNRWEPPAIGGDPTSLPSGEDFKNLEHVTAARAIVKYKINIFSCYHPLTCILAPTIHALLCAVTHSFGQ